MAYVIGILGALLVALLLTLGMGYGIGLMQIMVIAGVGLMSYGVADKFIGKGK